LGIADELLANRKQFAEIEVLDNGKPWAEADMDIGGSCYSFFLMDLVGRLILRE